MTGPREGPSPQSINTGPEAGPVVTPLRKRIEELTSELYESQRRLTNADNERLLLKKTLNESERRVSDSTESAKIAEQKVRERADSYYRCLACPRPRRPVFMNFPELVLDCYTSHSGPVPMTGHKHFQGLSLTLNPCTTCFFLLLIKHHNQGNL